MTDLADYRWPAACALLLAAPFVIAAMPPMVDLPGHEAVVSVLRHGSDASYFPPGLYVRNWGHPNQLQYLLAWPLAYLVGTTRAMQVVAALAIAAVILGSSRLARHLGRPAWVGVLAAPVAIGWNLHWGHIAGLLGLGATLGVLPDLDRFAQAPRWRSVPAVFAWLVLLYFAHEGALAIACLAIAVLSLAHGGGFASLALRASPCAAAIVGAWVQLQVQHLAPVNQATLAAVPFWPRVGFAPWTIVGYYDYHHTRLVFGLLVAIVVLNAARGFVSSRDGSAAARAPVPYRFIVLGLLFIPAYMLAPPAYLGVLFLFHRFLPVAWCLLVVATAAPAGAPFEVAGRVACGAAPALMLVFVMPSVVASDASYRRLDSMLPMVAKASTVFSAELDRGGMFEAFNPAGFSTRNAQGHVVAERGGRALADYTQSPISPVQVNPAYAWPQMTAINYLHPDDFSPRIVLSHFRYVLLHASVPQVALALPAAMAPEARLVHKDQDWLLFESTILETRSLEVPEPADYGPAEDTLERRLGARPPATTAAPAPSRP